MKHYCVVGNPVKHSLSPEIHGMFAEQSGLALQYRKIALDTKLFEEQLPALFNQGLDGCNVTVPFKQQAIDCCHAVSRRANIAGAVNTLKKQPDGSLFGDNTDGAGLCRDILQNHQLHARGLDLLVVGAGGATRGILQPLLELQPERVTLVNRTAAKAMALSSDFKQFGNIEACRFEELDGRRFDLIINATSMSISGETPPLPAGCVDSGTTCYDLMYAAEPTAFLRWAIQHGAASALDGLGMLVEQAAEAFFIWEGVRPDTTPVLARLRDQLS